MEARLRPRWCVLSLLVVFSRLAPGANLVVPPSPTVYALPLLTSLLDVTGQLLLVGAYAVAGLRTQTAAAGLEGAVDEAVGEVAKRVLATSIG